MFTLMWFIWANIRMHITFGLHLHSAIIRWNCFILVAFYHRQNISIGIKQIKQLIFFSKLLRIWCYQQFSRFYLGFQNQTVVRPSFVFFFHFDDNFFVDLMWKVNNKRMNFIVNTKRIHTKSIRQFNVHIFDIFEWMHHESDWWTHSKMIDNMLRLESNIQNDFICLQYWFDLLDETKRGNKRRRRRRKIYERTREESC